MAKVVLRQEAIDDLTDIWYYTIEKWSENQAEIYYNAIKQACIAIGINPNIGRAYTEISKDLLGLKSGKHIVFYYQISDNEIDIIRILHERMDLKHRIDE